MEDLTQAMFEPHIGSMFTVSKPGMASRKLKLAAVLEAPEKIRMGKDGKPLLECFSLYFEGGKEDELEQSTYSFSHDTIGEFELFMTSVVSPNPEIRCFQIVINRLLRQL